MSWMDEKYPMWFVYDYHCAAGRPKAEDAVFNHAKEKYLHCLVAEYLLEDIETELAKYCARIREENKRLAPVEIKFDSGHDGHKWLHIGQQSLHLRKVKDTME